MLSLPLFNKDQTPSQIMSAILDRGPTLWDDLHPGDRGSLGVGKLRLVGVYDDGFPGTFMLRTRIAGGRLTARQLKVIAGVVNDMSVKLPGSTEPERFAEITTRQNFQIHWIRFENLPEIWRRFSQAGLSSIEACGNSMRNITACPVDGIDEAGLFSVGSVLDELNAFAFDNQSLTGFLPRKFKVGVTACHSDCIVARVNCIAFTPARLKNSLGFNVHIGGGLSDYPRLASSTDLFVEPRNVVSTVKAALEVFVEFGDFQNSSINRFRAMVHELGAVRVEQEIRGRLQFEPEPAGEDLSSWNSEDHLGVHRAKDGSHYVGLCVPLGRLTGDELQELAVLSERYGDSQLRLTLRQNVILTGVKDVDGLIGEPLLSRLKPNPDPFERGVIACTSAPFCKFAILAMKPYGAKLIDHLRNNVPEQRWDRLDGLRIHMSGCKASCAQVALGHVGLRATMGKDERSAFDAFDVALGGDAGAGRLARWIRGEVPAANAFDAITSLLTKIANGEAEISNLSSESWNWTGGTKPDSAVVTE